MPTFEFRYERRCGSSSSFENVDASQILEEAVSLRMAATRLSSGWDSFTFLP